MRYITLFLFVARLAICSDNAQVFLSIPDESIISFQEPEYSILANELTDNVLEGFANGFIFYSLTTSEKQIQAEVTITSGVAPDETWGANTSLFIQCGGPGGVGPIALVANGIPIGAPQMIYFISGPTSLIDTIGIELIFSAEAQSVEPGIRTGILSVVIEDLP